jgi:hypothetical protein
MCGQQLIIGLVMGLLRTDVSPWRSRIGGHPRPTVSPVTAVPPGMRVCARDKVRC